MEEFKKQDINYRSMKPDMKALILSELLFIPYVERFG